MDTREIVELLKQLVGNLGLYWFLQNMIIISLGSLIILKLDKLIQK